MDRLERFIEEWSWLFRIALVILWALWAAQLYGPLVSGIKNEIHQEVEYQKSRDLDDEFKFQTELSKLAEEKLEKAKKAGASYGPNQYFTDLLELKQMASEHRVIEPHSQIEYLFQFLRKNEMEGHYKQSEIQKVAKKFESRFDEILGYDTKAKPINWAKAGIKVLNWFITLYLRSMLLSLALYLIRMSEWRGILATILAEKLRFVYSVLAWPAFLFKYPNNVVREIQVEAELRRLGGLFRRLSRTERELVRRVANSPEYVGWIPAFRFHNRLRRGVVLALMATLIINGLGLLPKRVHASPRKAEAAKVAVCYDSRAGPALGIEDPDENQTQGDDHSSGHQDCQVPPSELASPQEVVGVIKLEDENCYTEPPREVDHVPLRRLGYYLDQVAGGTVKFLQRYVKGGRDVQERGHHSSLNVNSVQRGLLCREPC